MRITSNLYYASVKRMFKKFCSVEEAEQHDNEYYIHLSVERRQAIARVLKERAYGDNVPDIRAYHKRK